MATIIAKRVVHDALSGSQADYARDLISYMNKPEKEGGDPEARREKCVAMAMRNFSAPAADDIQIAAEMAMDCALSSKLPEGQGIDHWVMSWKGEPTPDAGQIIEAADAWVEAMGYGGGKHKYLVSVHTDTDNVHAHIALCRVNQLTGKTKPRGWWKRENQRALAIVARECGFELEEGSRFYCKPNAAPEAITEIDEVTGREITRYAPPVTEMEPEDPATRQTGDREGRLESWHGVKSYKDILHERLYAFYEKHKDELPRMKWGHIHEALAREGIQVERREHESKKGKRYGLVYSLDGEHWQPASKVCRPMTWNALDGHIGAKQGSWRDARPEIAEILAQARTEIELTQPTEEARVEVQKEFSKPEIQALRSLPPDTVREALKADGVKLKAVDSKKVRNGLDVAIHEAGIPYKDAIAKLVGLFPDTVEAGRETGIDTCADIVAEAKRQAEAEDKPFREYKRGELGWEIQQEVTKWWRALQLDRIDIHTMISKAARESDPELYGLNQKDMTIYDVIRAIPRLMAIAAKGSTEDAPTSIFCGPKWAMGKVGIMVDDIKDPGFLKAYPATCIVRTSDRDPQAFWIVSRKYVEQAFYDAFMHHLNVLPLEDGRTLGDPKIRKVGHDTRIPGFYNKKLFMQDGSKRTPKAHVEFTSTRRPVEMEALIDEYRTRWETEKEAEKEAKKQLVVKPASRPAAANYETAGELAADPVMAETIKQAMDGMRLVKIPSFIKDTGLRAQAYFRKKAETDLESGKYPYVDRSRIDSQTARVLYMAGATMNEVFSFLADNMEQDDGLVTRPQGMRQRIRTPKEGDRQARRITANMTPAGKIADSWRTMNPDKYDIEQLYAFLLPRDDAEYKSRMESIRQAAAAQRTARPQQRTESREARQ